MFSGVPRNVVIYVVSRGKRSCRILTDCSIWSEIGNFLWVSGWKVSPGRWYQEPQVLSFWLHLFGQKLGTVSVSDDFTEFSLGGRLGSWWRLWFGDKKTWTVTDIYKRGWGEAIKCVKMLKYVFGRKSLRILKFGNIVWRQVYKDEEHVCQWSFHFVHVKHGTWIYSEFSINLEVQLP